MASESDPPASLPAPNLIALRDRREQVIARISDGYAEDLIEVDELERRLDVAYGARSLGELEALVADLSAPSATAALATTTTTSPVPSVTTALAVYDPSRAPTKKLRAVMSSIERRGRWVVPSRLEVRSLWASIELDFRDASLAPGVTVIDVSITMANLEIILPPGLAVDCDVSCFAGNVETRHRVPIDHDPNRPMLRIEGGVRFGNLEISTRLPGETERDARRRDQKQRKRERREQKALETGERKALPPG